MQVSTLGLTTFLCYISVWHMNWMSRAGEEPSSFLTGQMRCGSTAQRIKTDAWARKSLHFTEINTPSLGTPSRIQVLIVFVDAVRTTVLSVHARAGESTAGSIAGCFVTSNPAGKAVLFRHVCFFCLSYFLSLSLFDLDSCTKV